MLGTVIGLKACHACASISRSWGVRRTWRAAAISASIIPIALGRCAFRPVIICGNSMAPTLENGQMVAMESRPSEPFRRGDVVVFHRGRETCVKRVVALSGDSVCLIRFACGHTDLLEYSGPYTDYTRRTFRSLARMPLLGHLERFTVPAHSLFVMGDNEGVSDDSRSFGPIAEASVLGRISAQPDRPSRYSLANRAASGFLVMPGGARLPDLKTLHEQIARHRRAGADRSARAVASL